MADRTADLDLLLGTAQHTKTYPRGRVCAHEGCTTPLSVYNSEDVCAAHVGDKDDMRYLGYSFVVCKDCGEVIEKRKATTAGRCRKCSEKLNRAALARSERRRLLLVPEGLLGYWDGRLVRCPRCGVEKTLTHDNWSMQRRNGRRASECRECDRERSLQTYYRNRHKESV